MSNLNLTGDRCSVASTPRVRECRPSPAMPAGTPRGTALVVLSDMHRNGWVQGAVSLRVGASMALCVIAGTGGCAQHAAWDNNAPARTNRIGERSPLVFETPEVAEATGGVLAFERYEFSRNDDRVNAVRSAPLSATRTWPQPARPTERRIRFSDWQQR